MSDNSSVSDEQPVFIGLWAIYGVSLLLAVLILILLVRPAPGQGTGWFLALTMGLFAPAGSFAVALRGGGRPFLLAIVPAATVGAELGIYSLLHVPVTLRWWVVLVVAAAGLAGTALGLLVRRVHRTAEET